MKQGFNEVLLARLGVFSSSSQPYISWTFLQYSLENPFIFQLKWPLISHLIDEHMIFSYPN